MDNLVTIQLVSDKLVLEMLLYYRMILGAVDVMYDNVPGPYSYQMYCNESDLPSTLGECVTDEHQPLCPRMIAGGVICQGSTYSLWCMYTYMYDL